MTNSPVVRIISAYDSASTLNETPRGVHPQTNQELEIIVLNDRSADDTRTIAKRHALVDRFVLIIPQVHATLAEARNTDWEPARSNPARSNLIAFLDIDNLGAPTKIEKQVQAIRASGEHVGLVYSWFTPIDRRDFILNSLKRARCECYVLVQPLAGSFVGTGSSALIRRQALIDANGHHNGLQAPGAEGCDHLLLSCRVTEKYNFAVVTEHLIGDRCHPQNMSSNRSRMLRSWIFVYNEMLVRQPGHCEALKKGVRNYADRLFRNALSNNQLRHLPPLLLLFALHFTFISLPALLKSLPSALIGMVRARLLKLLCGKGKSMNAATGQRFLIGEPDSCY